MKRFRPTMSAHALAAALALATLLFTPACQRSSSRRAAAPDSAAVALADSVTVRHLVLEFGTRLKQVSLLAPDSALERSMQSEYADLVSPMLLRKWGTDPRHGAGRLTSSPWPDRIEIGAMSRKSPRVFLVDGDIVERTSVDSVNGARIPVRLAVWKAGRKWLIMNYDQGPPRPATSVVTELDNDPALTQERAAAVLRAYYDAINAKQFRDAYLMWEADGAASGQSLIEFLNGYAQTQSVEVSIGTPGPMGAAAGSRYVDVPIRLIATNHAGARESFSGTYTLRRSVVDGASAKQRTWHIYSAKIRKERPA